MTTSNSTADRGPEELYTATDIAKVARGEFDRLWKVLMAAVDVCQYAQQEHHAMRFDRLRAVTSREARMAAAMHAAAIGDLLDRVQDDDHQEYGDELTAFAAEVSTDLPEIDIEDEGGES